MLSGGLDEAPTRLPDSRDRSPSLVFLTSHDRSSRFVFAIEPQASSLKFHFDIVLQVGLQSHIQDGKTDCYGIHRLESGAADFRSNWDEEEGFVLNGTDAFVIAELPNLRYRVLGLKCDLDPGHLETGYRCPTTYFVTSANMDYVPTCVCYLYV
ncbi:hypothetical protein GALMADRAFT_144529 [Galerina marginata CBS 339.88]|uniref:Uncharacterized protein n=1 Tax=Galerina marginata (strain CBS 339.88) TaxID=685588 RepID=A0A067SV31_GALM3|nr:hypothetical protein GALMADRAFT_144529 [Galerina marginata CBS 339.88]